jgi:hypothetical protein
MKGRSKKDQPDATPGQQSMHNISAPSTPASPAVVNQAPSNSAALDKRAGEAPEPRNPGEARTRRTSRKTSRKKGSRGTAMTSPTPPSALDPRPQPGLVASVDRPGSAAGEIADPVAGRDGCVKADRVDMLKVWADEPAIDDEVITLVRPDKNETALIPFTSEGELVKIHYCDDPEINGYVHCNGSDCLLCRIGRHQDERILLPVYVPTSRSVGVLAISPNSRPGALRPQLMPILSSGKRVAILIRYPDKVTYRVGTVELQEGVADGASVIGNFLTRWKAGRVDIKAVYQRISNRDLAELPDVAEMMKLKGIEP